MIIEKEQQQQQQEIGDKGRQKEQNKKKNKNNWWFLDGNHFIIIADNLIWITMKLVCTMHIISMIALFHSIKHNMYTDTHI